MASQETERNLAAIRAASDALAGQAGRSAALNAEISLIADRIETLSNTPPTKKTSAFDLQGESVPFPESDEAVRTLERVIDESDFLPISFLEQGLAAQRSVARVVLTKPHQVGQRVFPPGTGWATGFLVSPSLFLTNNHVIEDQAFMNKIRLQFNFQIGPDGIERPTDSYLPVLDGEFETNPALDYTLIRLRSKPVDDPAIGVSVIAPGQRWGFIPLNPDPVYRKGQHFNIIQHPSGRMKEIALQDNEIDRLFVNAVRYKGDTEPGSSGSPVFDNIWQLVALHHAGGEKDAEGKWINNQGIRIDRIVEDLRSRFSDTADRSIRDELGI